MRTSRPLDQFDDNPLLRDVAFNRHSKNDGSHNSPFGDGTVHVGTDNIKVRLLQGLDENKFREVLGRSLMATTGIDPDTPLEEVPWEEMMRGGLQAVLESQVVIFEVSGISRALTHQLVRTRRAAFHQQSQRATFMGYEPEVRMPESIWRNPTARYAFERAIDASRSAYQIACEEDIAYQDARFVLPEAAVTYIMCEFPLREFINTYAYRACSMFMWEHVYVMREMKKVLVAQHPWLDTYIRISCQDSEKCPDCKGSGMLWIYEDDSQHHTHPYGEEGWRPFTRNDHEHYVTCDTCGGSGFLGHKCTFAGWESPEGQCPFPWAKDSLRTFKPDPKLRI